MRKALLIAPVAIGIFIAVVIILNIQQDAAEAAKWSAQVKQEEIDKEQKARASEQEIYKLVNDIRVQNNKPALQWDDVLADLTRVRATQLSLKEVQGHANAEYYKQSTRCDLVGENLVDGASSNYDRQSLVDGWVESPHHKQNMLQKEWQYTGVGYSTDQMGYQYVVQAFCT